MHCENAGQSDDSCPGHDRGGGFITFRATYNLKHEITDYWNFPLSICRAWLTVGDGNHRKQYLLGGVATIVEFRSFSGVEATEP